MKKGRDFWKKFLNVVEKERLLVGDDNDLMFGKIMVVKFGKIMGRWIGVYKYGIFLFKVDELFCNWKWYNFKIFRNCLCLFKFINGCL